MHSPGLIRTFPIGEHHTVTLNPSLGCVVAKTDEENRRLIVAHQTQNVNVSLPSTLLWRSKATESAGIAQTASLPIELECIVQGYCENFSSIYTFMLIWHSGRKTSSVLPEPTHCERTRL